MNHATILHGLKTYQDLSDVNDKLFLHDIEYYKLLLSLERPELDLLLDQLTQRLAALVDLEKTVEGMAGIYNPSITQRLNGLTDKSEIKQDVNVNKLPDWLVSTTLENKGGTN